MFNSTTLTILSLILGIVAWILPMVGFTKGYETDHVKRLVLSIFSITACATSICIQYHYMNHLVIIKDFSAIEDITGAMSFVVTVLLIGTILLNILPLFILFKRKH